MNNQTAATDIWHTSFADAIRACMGAEPDYWFTGKETPEQLEALGAQTKHPLANSPSE